MLSVSFKSTTARSHPQFLYHLQSHGLVPYKLSYYWRVVLRQDPSLTEVIGCALLTLGLLLTSFSGEFTSTHRPVYYQVLLSQGILCGLGMSLLLVSSTAITPTYFIKNRAFAVGLANTDASLGGIVYPILT